jgi:hypothetical protein
MAQGELQRQAASPLGSEYAGDREQLEQLAPVSKALFRSA